MGPRPSSGGEPKLCAALFVIKLSGRYCLALALLVTWVLANHHDTAVAADDLALVANLLDARVYLHALTFLLVAVDDAAAS